MSRSEPLLVEHLLRRAGFGSTPDELKQYAHMGYDRSLKQLLNPESENNDALDANLKAQNFDFTRIDDLKRWWIYRMAYTNRPLEKKMTLFWHGHFATSNAKVADPYAMYLQNQKFRQLGMGNFGDLLLAMSKDTAMIKWLDGQQNRKGKANENYAREVMELFSLGIGNYSETDIKETARAFTGWWTKDSGFYFEPKQHDAGEKTVLGQTGNWNGDDIVRILVQQPCVGPFLATKMCKFFAADQPSEKLVHDVAAAYKPRGENIKHMLQVLIKHHDFKSETAYHAKIKSPVELVIGTLKGLQVKQLDADLPAVLSRMGQDIFAPPSVKGWDGGSTWIATDTMLQRFNFATRITQEKFDEMQAYVHPVELVRQQGLTDPPAVVNYFLKVLVNNDVPEQTPSALIGYLTQSGNGKQVDPFSDDKILDSKLRGLVHLIMTLPTYQLA